MSDWRSPPGIVMTAEVLAAGLRNARLRSHEMEGSAMVAHAYVNVEKCILSRCWRPASGPPGRTLLAGMKAGRHLDLWTPICWETHFAGSSGNMLKIDNRMAAALVRLHTAVHVVPAGYTGTRKGCPTIPRGHFVGRKALQLAGLAHSHVISRQLDWAHSRLQLRWVVLWQFPRNQFHVPRSHVAKLSPGNDC